MAESLKGKVWRALTGINYYSVVKEEEVRAEPGDKIEDMSENAARHERAAKNIEEWEPRQTENVRDPDDEDTDLQGVRSRHENEGEDIVLKEVE